MEGTQGQQERIIDLFYRAILDPTNWSEALQRVAGLMHCESASIILYDRNSGQAALSHSFGTAEETLAAYHAYYCKCDPGLDAIRKVAVGDWYLDRRELGMSFIRQSEFYNDFVHVCGLQGIMTNRLVYTHGVEGGLSLQRAIGHRPFDQTDMELASGIIPHLQRVIAIHMKLQAAAHREACLNSMIDSINFAMLSVDRQAKVLHLNAAAERLIQQHRMIDVTSGELAMAGIAPHCLLQMIARACGEPPQAGIEMLRDEQGFPCMQLVVTPLAQEEAGGVSDLGGPYALVVLKPLDAAGPVSEPLLHELYGLTPAESRLSVLLLQGASVGEAAELACVSLNTVRTQLKSVFAKTGTRRQADLVRKLSLLSSLWH
jgi:DNA-binding CsgD family transcriptional regulator/PAS domain-containing protein